MRWMDSTKLGVTLLIAVFTICALIGTAVPAQPGPPVDQNKYRSIPPNNDLILYYQDVDLDGFHDPGETFYNVSAGNDNKGDMSCWMASAANMVTYTGRPNPYGQPAPGQPGWLGNGGAGSPVTSPWGTEFTVSGGGAFRTFDDGGWQQWCFDHEGLGYLGPIITEPEFEGGAWATDPIAWCQARLAEDHPVGITIWWGKVTRGMLPGRVDLSLPGGYHAITLWEINEGAGTVTITDSDDGVVGTRTCNYTYAGNVWQILNLYSGVDATVNYAVALEDVPRVPSLSLVGALLLMLVVILTGIIIIRHRRQVA